MTLSPGLAPGFSSAMDARLAIVALVNGKLHLSADA